MVSKLAYVFLVSVLFLQCSKKSSIADPADNEYQGPYGTLAFYINRSNVPDGVAGITITFTRALFAPFSDSARLDLILSTTLRFDSIATGAWQMKTVMRNNAGNIVSTDEKNFVVEEDTLTQLLGVTAGGEFIYIPLSDSIQTWIDNSSNPVLARSDSDLPVRWIYNPIVLSEDDTFYVWFTGIQVDSSARTINFAQSMDGEQWILGSNQPILKPGSPVDWDYNHIATGPIIKENGVYRLYYNSLSDFIPDWKVGLATSTDKIQWIKHGNPVLVPEGSEGRVNAVAVIKIGSSFYMYYNHLQGTGLAISTDGINWSKNVSSILRTTYAWEGSQAIASCVFYENGLYRMIYYNSEASKFGEAVSLEGIYWFKISEDPFFTKDQTSNLWAIDQIAYCSAISVNGRLRLFYSGYNGALADWRIGFADEQ